MAVASETTRQSPTTLVELIGRETLQSIQDAFATAFDIPTVILDHEGRNVNEITFRVRFCEDLTRPSTVGDRCLSCDVAAMRESEATRRPTTFRCWAGLNDSTVPIVSSDGRLFGHFLAGQVHYEAPTDTSRFRAIAREIGLDEHAYEAAARGVRVIPEDVYRHRIDCLGILARMIADQASAALANRSLLDDALSANEQTRRMTAELEAIASQVSLISGGDDLLATVSRLVDAARDVVPFDGAAVFLQQGADFSPVLVRDDGLIDAEQYGAVAAAARNAQEVLLLERDRALAIPLVLDGQPLGAIVLRRHAPAAFSSHDHDLLTIVGGQVATAVGVARLREDTERVLALSLVRDGELRQMAAEVDGGAILMRLLDQAVQSLDALDAALLPRAEGADPVLRTGATARVERLGASLEGAIARARGTGRPAVTRFVDDEHALVMPAAPVGARSGYDLVVWRSQPWTDFDMTLGRSVASGIEFVADAEVRRTASRLGAARQRALAALIARLRANSAIDVDELVAEATGFPRVIRVGRGDIDGVLVVHDPHSPTADPVHAVILDGRADLRPPAGDADDSLWDGWSARIAAEIGAAPSSVVCGAIDSAEIIALIGVDGDGRRDELVARLRAVGDLLALATAPAAAPSDDVRALLIDRIHLAARAGSGMVRAAAADAQRAIGGRDDETDARVAAATREALAIADELAEAAQVRDVVALEIAELRERERHAHLLMGYLEASDPIAAVRAAIAERLSCEVAIEDADGWVLSGESAGARWALDGGVGAVRTDGALSDIELHAVRLAVERSAQLKEHERALRAAIAEALIEADDLTPDLVRRCGDVGFDARSPSRVCVIDVGDGLEAAIRSLHHWASPGTHSLVGRRDDQAVLIGPDDPQWFADAIEAIAERHPATSAGLGHPALGAPGIKRSFASGRQAAGVLRVTGRTGVLEIQDDSLESILVEAAEPARLVRFVESVVNPLLAYDDRKGAELVRTLETAVRLGWNLQGAARDCHVHVSTFRYRLARIEQLTGLDLASADGRLTAELALRARRALG